MLSIVNAPNAVLSQKAKKVNKFDKTLLKFIVEMKQSLLSARDPVGVGLAAPQVGKSLQIFIAKPTPKSKIQAFINPIIVSTIEYKVLSKDKNILNTKYKIHNTKLEGCLSLKDIWGEVKRHPHVLLSYQDESGKKYSKKFSGFMAAIIQHETDHLNGILFPKRVLEQKNHLYKSRKDEKGEDIFEEIEI